MSEAFENHLEIQARRRNLRISILKSIAQQGNKLDQTYTVDAIIDQFKFRQRDIKYHMTCFFQEGESQQYNFCPEMRKFLEKALSAHRQAIPSLEDAKIIFLKEFGRFHDWCNVDMIRNFDYQKLQNIYQRLQNVIPILHWGLLPILNKYLMINSGIIPEDNVIQFYDHYDMLCAMLSETRGEGKTMTTKGDETLNQELPFSVYTRRWGHNDCYRIKRTVDGWHIGHIAISGDCDKAGTNALFANLNHDSVFYPEDGVKYAMSNLWEDAEDGKLTLSELQERLQQIADWISTVERAVGEGQPQWVRYY